MILGLGQQASAANILQNGGFETGSMTPWENDPTNAPPFSIQSPGHTSSYAAGVKWDPSTEIKQSAVEQVVDPPQCAEYLEFWYRGLWTGPSQYEGQVLQFYFYYSDDSYLYTPIILPVSPQPISDWTRIHVDLDTTKQVREIGFIVNTVVGSFEAGNGVEVYIDDVVLEPCQTSAPSNPTGNVGGEVFSPSKAVIVAPYLMALFSLVAVAAVVVKRRRF